MALKYANNAKTTLNGAITNVATSITVTNGAVFPALGGSDYFYMTLEDVTLQNEIVKVTAVAGNVLTIVRAQNGTTAKAFANADKAEGRVVTGILDDLAALVNGVVPGSAFMALVDDTTNGALLTTLGINANVQTWLATPSSANLLAAMSDKTGTGLLVFGTSPTLTTPALGTPSALVLTNATGLPLASVTGLGSGVATWLATPSSANLRAAMTDESGSGALLFAGGALGTPASGVLTNCTGLPNASVIGLGTAALVADNTLVHLSGAETLTGNKRLGNGVYLEWGPSGDLWGIGKPSTTDLVMYKNGTPFFTLGTVMSFVGTPLVGSDPVMTRGATETVSGAKTFTSDLLVSKAGAKVTATSNTSADPGYIFNVNGGRQDRIIATSTGLYIGVNVAGTERVLTLSSAGALNWAGTANIGPSGTGLLIQNTAVDYQHTIDKDNTGVIFATNSGTRGFRWSIGGTRRLDLDTNGSVIVDSASTPMYLNAVSSTPVKIEFRDNGTLRGQLGSNGSYPLYVNNGSGANIFFVGTTGAVLASEFTLSSDETLKKDFTPFTGALDIVRQLRTGEYTRISTGKREYGFMAQDFERAGVPLFVDNTTSTKSLKYPRTPALLAAAIKELLLRVEALEAR